MTTIPSMKECIDYTDNDNNNDNSIMISTSIASSPAHQFELYDWKPDPERSDDENYLDVVLLITRSVQEDGQQGHMGALIVRPTTEDTTAVSTTTTTTSTTTTTTSSSVYESNFFQSILGAATNTPLFGGKDVTSDIHAEINALGQVCRSCQSSVGCTAYITIHPCKRCFAALVTFGITRIVCRRQLPTLIVQTAIKHNISVSHLSYDQQRQQTQRINRLLQKNYHHHHHHTSPNDDHHQQQDQQQQRILGMDEQLIKQKRIERKLADKARKQKKALATNQHVVATSVTSGGVVTVNPKTVESRSQQRRLWLSPEDLTNLSSNHGTSTQSTHNNDSNYTTYDSLFQQFSSKPERQSLTKYLWKTLSVGQEFVLTCLLLAGHRAAMVEEDEFLLLLLQQQQQQQQQYSQSHSDEEIVSFPVQSHRLWNSLAMVWSTLFISVLHTRFATSQQYRFQHRLTDFALMAILLRLLSAVLKTLTASYSSDTVYALSIGTSFLHLLACNYSYANGWNDEDDDDDDEKTNNKETTTELTSGDRLKKSKRPLFKGGTISLTSIFFATALLASRLQHNITVYIFVCFSVVLFALYPAARHLVAASNSTFVPVSITGILTVALLLLLEDRIEIALVVTTLFLIVFVVPLWKHHLQQHKVLLRGPWDIAHV
ncbi:phosphatidylinositol N-acetylglucosaminyltransferase [Nitzschia inconspicua]|uniref:Phosphatidylinositol N-acetylglucosaminyltransferase n=1 Tax=Nitzschia inconspicua TaxID=303405 RepID=A0A9K3M276_9STRA|nr:phosphatidylinositol N-acetylglucosaminyltransferase [Nitzschia inconspicua]